MATSFLSTMTTPVFENMNGPSRGRKALRFNEDIVPTKLFLDFDFSLPPSPPREEILNFEPDISDIKIEDLLNESEIFPSFPCNFEFEFRSDLITFPSNLQFDSPSDLLTFQSYFEPSVNDEAFPTPLTNEAFIKEEEEDFTRRKINSTNRDLILATQQCEEIFAKTKIETKSKKLQNLEKQVNPRILLKLKFAPPPNPISKELIDSVMNGEMPDPVKNIRIEELHDSAECFPSYADPEGIYDAFSKGFFIHQNVIRRKLNAYNSSILRRKCPPISISNEKHDQLLSLQMAHFQGTDPNLIPSPNMKRTKRRSPTPLKNISNNNNNNNTLSSLPKVRIIVENNEILYLQTHERKYLVERTAVVIPRLTDAEIQAALNPHATTA